MNIQARSSRCQFFIEVYCCCFVVALRLRCYATGPLEVFEKLKNISQKSSRKSIRVNCLRIFVVVLLCGGWCISSWSPFATYMGTGTVAWSTLQVVCSWISSQQQTHSLKLRIPCCQLSNGQKTLLQCFPASCLFNRYPGSPHNWIV